MNTRFSKMILLIPFCIILLCLVSCSDNSNQKTLEQKQEETLTIVLTKLCTAPDETLQKAYIEAKAEAQKASQETSEPGAYGVYDFDNLLKEMYGSYFTDQGINSIPYWIYTNLNAYAADRDVKVAVKSVNVLPEESSDGSYYTFSIELKYSIGNNEFDFEQKGTALFQDEKIQNIYFNDGLMTEIESHLFNF